MSLFVWFGLNYDEKDNNKFKSICPLINTASDEEHVATHSVIVKGDYICLVAIKINRRFADKSSFLCVFGKKLNSD